MKEVWRNVAHTPNTAYYLAAKEMCGLSYVYKFRDHVEGFNLNEMDSVGWKYGQLVDTMSAKLVFREMGIKMACSGASVMGHLFRNMAHA